MQYKIKRSEDFLYHHGILGMKWGKRNGPPYPLDGPDHSASEKKAGWRKSLNKGKSSSVSVPETYGGAGGGVGQNEDDQILDTLYEELDNMSEEEALQLLSSQSFVLTLAEFAGVDSSKLSKQQLDRLLKKAINRYSKTAADAMKATNTYVKNDLQLKAEKAKNRETRPKSREHNVTGSVNGIRKRGSANTNVSARGYRIVRRNGNE